MMLYLLLVERKQTKKQKVRNSQSTFFLGQMCPVGCATLGFPQLLGAVKGSFMSQFLTFI
jgi:hypothetical protein